MSYLYRMSSQMVVNNQQLRTFVVSDNRRTLLLVPVVFQVEKIALMDSLLELKCYLAKSEAAINSRQC